MNVDDIRSQFVDKYQQKDFRMNGTLELQGVSFTADRPYIFKLPKTEYISAEIEWYDSIDLRVEKLYKIYGKKVDIWDRIKDSEGMINSNYGWMIYSITNGDQYRNCLKALGDCKYTRQAVMIYQRPSMHIEAGKDFTCTNVVQYFINEYHMDCVVQMRSNDITYGYPNDYAWQSVVLHRLCLDMYKKYDYPVQPGKITWQVGSLHMYLRDDKYIKEYIERKENGKL